MMVETYYNKELSDISFEVEALDEWKAIATELGFEAQLSLTKGKESPIPYPFMNTVMERVYETLCPMKVDFKSYKKSTIPLEVMKQIAFSVRDKHFGEIQIWYNDKDPDPIVVGKHGVFHACAKASYTRLKGEDGKDITFTDEAEANAYLVENVLTETYKTYFTEEAKYIIARWGDELMDFPSLKKQAVESFIENLGGELKREIATKTEKLKLLTDNAASYMNGNATKHDVTGSW